MSHASQVAVNQCHYMDEVAEGAGVHGAALPSELAAFGRLELAPVLAKDFFKTIDQDIKAHLVPPD